MVDEIIIYYKTKVTSYSLVFKYMKHHYTLVRVLVVFFLISFFLLTSNFISLFVDAKKIVPFIWYFLLSSFFLTISLILFNRKAKKIVKERYKIESKKKVWRTKEYEKMRINLMNEYLNRMDLLSEKKINLLKEILNNKLKNSTIPSLIAPGVLLAFIGPVWVEFIKFTFQKNVNSYEQAITSLVGISIAVVLIIATFNGGKFIYKEVKELFSMNDSLVTKYLINFLDEVLLLVPNDTSKNLSISFMDRKGS